MDCDKAETKLAQPLVSFENDEACLEIPEGLKRTRFKLAPASVNRSRLLASMIEQAKSSDDETRAPIPISSMELLQWLKHVQTEAGPPQEVRQPRAQARSIRWSPRSPDFVWPMPQHIWPSHMVCRFRYRIYASKRTQSQPKPQKKIHT